MSPDPIKILTSEDEPVTSGDVAKWLGILIASIALIASIGYGYATLQAQVTANTKANEQTQHNLDEYITRNDKQLADEVLREAVNERVVSDLNRKLDVAVAILERIDKKVNP